MYKKYNSITTYVLKFHHQVSSCHMEKKIEEIDVTTSCTHQWFSTLLASTNNKNSPPEEKNLQL